MRTICLSIVIGCVACGCSATPTRPEKGGVVFDHPPGAVHKASLDAMTANGFEIQKEEPLYVEGYRPRKMGAFVGSGGETAGIWLEMVPPDKTRVLVATAKSFVGIAGQKIWDEELLAAMRKSLAVTREPVAAK
jgi:hypothetical protein